MGELKSAPHKVARDVYGSANGRPPERLERLHDGTPAGWYVGRTAFDERRNEWSVYAIDTAYRPKVGRRSRDWTAVHPTQSGVVR